MTSPKPIADDLLELAELAHVIEEEGAHITDVDVRVGGSAPSNPMQAMLQRGQPSNDDGDRDVAFRFTVSPRGSGTPIELEDNEAVLACTEGDCEFEAMTEEEYDEATRLHECPECGGDLAYSARSTDNDSDSD